MTPSAQSALLLLFTAAEDQEAFDRMLSGYAVPLLRSLPAVAECRLDRARTGPLGHPPYEWSISLRFPDRQSVDTALASAPFGRFEDQCRPWAGLCTLLVAEEWGE